MSTFMANKANIERKWYILDAAGKPLGKTAVRAADLLRGKNKTTFTPHADCGDNVIIINAGKAVLTGKKGEQKIYRTHSGIDVQALQGILGHGVLGHHAPDGHPHGNLGLLLHQDAVGGLLQAAHPAGVGAVDLLGALLDRKSVV